MRAYDRDLIRGGHYGQRSCEPHSKAEHMAAPTKSCDVKKVLANSEPSTHGHLARKIRRLIFSCGCSARLDNQKFGTGIISRSRVALLFRPKPWRRELSNQS